MTIEEMLWILKDRQPLMCDSLEEYALFMRDWVRNCRVGLTHFDGGVRVSTVFLGTRYNHGQPGAPTLFETAIFRGEKVEIFDRYSSWDDAEVGHEAACRAVQQDETGRAGDDDRR